LSVDGIEKLYIGTASTIVSAASSATISWSANATLAACPIERCSAGVISAPNESRLRCGMRPVSAFDHRGAGVGAAPGIDKPTSNLRRFRLVAEKAQGDQQKVIHVRLSEQAVKQMLST
jgi:hypothetical protein